MNAFWKSIKRIALCGMVAAMLGFAMPGIHAQTNSSQNYPIHQDAKSQIHYALITAGMQNKRVLVNFGANSCHNCTLLNSYLRDSANFRLIKDNYVLLDVNVGANFDQNLDIARDYGLTLKKGVPALVVLERPGHAVSAQSHADFSELRGPSAVSAFLEKWEPNFKAKKSPSPNQKID